MFKYIVEHQYDICEVDAGKVAYVKGGLLCACFQRVFPPLIPLEAFSRVENMKEYPVVRTPPFHFP